jgi:GNAT superfamily N-acetyltransferase
VDGNQGSVSDAARAEALFASGVMTAFELGEGRLPDVQRLFESNPGYFTMVLGEPAGPDAARETFERLPPEGWPCTRKWGIDFRGARGDLVAIADIVSDLFAAGVWHVGLFMVAGPLHGTGVAQEAYAALEAWMQAQGARFLRLGVVEGNARAERFWRSRGYLQVHRRPGVVMGRKTHTLAIMAKPLGSATLEEYLARVGRDPSGGS